MRNYNTKKAGSALINSIISKTGIVNSKEARFLSELDLTGLSVWLDPNYIVYGGSGPLQHNDLSGFKSIWTGATQPSAIVNSLNGNPVLNYNGTSQYLNAVTNQDTAGVITMHLVMKGPAISGASTQVSGVYSRNNGTTFDWSFYQRCGLVSENWINTGSQNGTGQYLDGRVPNSYINFSQWNVITIVANATTIKTYVNGLLFGLQVGTFNYTSGGAGGTVIGAHQPGGFYTPMQQASFIKFSINQTDAQRNAVIKYLGAKYGITVFPKNARNIICAGNSLTFGQGASEAYTKTWPSKYFQSLGVTSPDTVYSIGYPGDTVSNMTAQAAIRVDNKYDSVNFAKNICVFWEITNEIGNTANTAATVYSRVVAYCNARRAIGWKVVVVTCLPGAYSTYRSDFNTIRNGVNALIVANWATFADALADVGNDATIGPDAACNNTTYYNADKLHLTDLSYASYVAPIIGAAINSL